jgi:hypothetical protein
LAESERGTLAKSSIEPEAKMAAADYILGGSPDEVAETDPRKI